ncbi:hypothetical protein [Sulfurovum sp.]|jgi:hypothetical protein|uniref:hypothetical protein n=1 Tax=Sulfurovum sp. TaxID=1969726 RepID=UPI0025D59A5F|nr:hypothetical protein [Sulfurovum sp.]
MKKYFILGFLTLGVLMGCTQNGDLELEGGLYMKGSSPHSYLVIEDQKSHKSYKIQNAKVFNLTQRQKEVVKLKAKLVKKAIGPGFPAVIEVVEVK